MSSAALEPFRDQKPASLVSELYDDSDTSVSDVSMSSSAAESFNDRGFSPVPSDQRSIYSYTSSVNREFILKDLHGRVVNNTNEVK